MDDRELVNTALKMKENAYAPYSHFHVGAAVLAESGNVYTGINIENLSYGATNCAERTAMFKAVSEGERKIKAIAVAGDTEDYIYPCGICRQVLAEFCSSDTRILCSNRNGEFKTYRLDELLPNSFTL